LKDTDKSASSAEPSERFPSPVYADTVLAVNFDDAKNYFLDALLDIEVTHTLMLARQGIMPEREARLCLEALGKLDRAAILAERYDGHCEDLFFYIEDALARACGADVAGKMQTARSRNDIDLTMYRLRLRGEVLRIASETLAATRNPRSPPLSHITCWPPSSVSGGMRFAFVPPLRPSIAVRWVRAPSPPRDSPSIAATPPACSVSRACRPTPTARSPRLTMSPRPWASSPR
jgi:hypothetical protein